MADKKRDPGKPLSKTDMFVELANTNGLTRKQVAAFFESLTALISRELGKKGPGQFVLPGLLRLKKVVKPASKGGMRPNPFKPGEMMEVKPKPAKNVAKAQPLKGLKELVK